MTELAELKVRLLEDSPTRAEYDSLAPEFALARELITARTCAGHRQSEIPSRARTPHTKP